MANDTEITDDIDLINTPVAITCVPEELNNQTKITKTSLSLLTLNIRSINCLNNFSELEVLLQRLNCRVDIITLTECWLDNHKPIPTLQGYKSFHTSKYINQNNGVVVYVRDNLKVTAHEPGIDDCDCLVITLENGYTVVSIYRPHEFENPTKFIYSLDDWLTSNSNIPNIIVTGDININIVPTVITNIALKFLNTLAMQGLMPTHYLPTRESSCLDHMHAKTTHDIFTAVLDTHVTDHMPVLLNITKTDVRRSNHTRFYKKIDFTAILEDVKNKDFSSILEDTNADTAADKLVCLLRGAVETNSITTKVPRSKNNHKSWITPGLIKCIKKRDRLHRVSKKDPTNFEKTKKI